MFAALRRVHTSPGHGYLNPGYPLAGCTQIDPLTLLHAQEPLPNGYELILCRDALQHLPLLSVVAALENFARSDARYLLVRTEL